MRPVVVRWAGFGGSVATAVTAYKGGSGFVRIPSVNPITLLSGQRGFLLPICWVLGTAVLISAWWFGRRVGRERLSIVAPHPGRSRATSGAGRGSGGPLAA